MPVKPGGPLAARPLTLPAALPETAPPGGMVKNFTSIAAALLAAGCSDTALYSIGGTVSGLSGTLVLQDDGGDDLTLTASGPFTFKTRLKKDAAYAVTVHSQPAGQTCAVASGSGTVGAAPVTSVSVGCAANTYTVGGSVSGLSGTLVLQDNGGDDLTLTANGPFTFHTPVGAAYAVTVRTQPAGQLCSLSGNSGTVSGANVTGVAVTCAAAYSIAGSVGGLSGSVGVQDHHGGRSWTISANGAFTFYAAVLDGTSYDLAVASQPAGQTCAIAGGTGAVSGANVTGVAVSCAANAEWTWLKGANLVNASGTYGTEGTGAAANTPGGRYYPCTAQDASGNLWLFGGESTSFLNDLWKWDGAQWTWISGSSSTGASGNYGTVGVPASTNVPGARYQSACWVDASGKFWLFAGYGYDGAGLVGQLDDLWRFDGTNWTWMGGATAIATSASLSSHCSVGITGCNDAGTYGTRGVADAANFPGAHVQAAFARDAAGNFWLFGGYGVDGGGTDGWLSDLWKFDGSKWTWVAGSSTASTPPVYGTLGVPSGSNLPGPRYGAAGFFDGSGKFWLFGGYGEDGASHTGDLGDLWKFDSGDWVWMGGSSAISSSGSYGTQGAASAANVPGARLGAAIAVDAGGDAWLFGGAGYDSAGAGGNLNDLWKFDGSQWTWVAGSSTVNAAPSYGTEGTAAPGHTPGARYGASGWLDASGNFWLFGGHGSDPASNVGVLDDLWRY